MKVGLSPQLWARLRALGCTCNELTGYQIAVPLGAEPQYVLNHDDGCPLLKRLQAANN